MTYTIKIQPSNHTFQAEPGEKILDAALRQGLSLAYGCRNGACGSCLGELVEGAVSYDDRNRSALNASMEEQGKLLICQAVATSDLVINAKELTSATEIEVKRLPVRVEEKNLLCHDVMELKLKLPETERLQFMPGQYIDILQKDQPARAFSLANPPHRDDLLELHIRHVEGGSFTDFVFNELQVKDLMRIEGPHGSFYLDDEGHRPIIMVAGGTGFAPMQAILEHAVEDNDPRPIHLFWGVRAKRDLYRDTLASEWAEQHSHISYTPVLSEPMEEDNWQGETGFVHEAVLRAYPNIANYDVYMAGPPVMVNAAVEDFTAAGLPQEQMFSDSFEFSTPAKK
jgi:CDP-4-dehydro-6-deoxyglucose reductase